MGFTPFALAALLSIGLACAPGAGQRPSAEVEAAAAAERAEEARAARFQAALDALREETGIPGATAAYVLPDGTVRGFASGLADLASKEPMSAETRMLSGSIGKTFVAATVLAAANEGALRLDDRLADWLGEEEWFPRLPNGSTITLRHLLSHSSGLADHVYLESFVVAWNRLRDTGDPDAWLSPRELVELILDTEPRFPPGEGYAYTDTGYILAGMALERALGKPYYDEVGRRFLERFALARTSPSNRRALDGLAAGYVESDNAFGLPPSVIGPDGALLYNPAIEWTGGGLVTNPQDLVRWAKLLYEGKAIDGDYLGDLLESGYRGDDAATGYGLGVYLYRTAFGPAYGHGGWIPGYNSVLRYYPKERFALAVQINRSFDNDLEAIADRLAGAFLGVS